MFQKISSLATLPNYILLVGFQNGEYRQFDLKPYIEKYPPFKSLTEVNGLYESAKIDVGGYGIVWNDDLDVSADGVYEKGVPCSPPQDVEKSEQRLISDIVSARKASKLSQKQLEVLSGVAQPCIARIETNNSDPKLSTLLKMLEPMGLTLAVIPIATSQFRTLDSMTKNEFDAMMQKGYVQALNGETTSVDEAFSSARK